jgi:phenylpyruvate tautomerase PptA (4-oxalocrotonate tautomerase family)
MEVQAIDVVIEEVSPLDDARGGSTTATPDAQSMK